MPASDLMSFGRVFKLTSFVILCGCRGEAEPAKESTAQTRNSSIDNAERERLEAERAKAVLDKLDTVEKLEAFKARREELLSQLREGKLTGAEFVLLNRELEDAVLKK